MNKTAIKNFAIWARRKLISDITYKAGMLGITENGVAQPLSQSTRDLQFFDIGTKDYAEVSGTALEQRNALIKVIQAKEKTSDYKTAFRNVVEEVAYTWFNRLIAIRFMEINDYLPSRIRVLSSENEGKLEPDFVTNPFDTDLEFTAFERDKVFQLKEGNKLDELFRMLFIKQCNKLSEILPGLFEQISDYTELLLNISFTDKDGIVYHLAHDISEDDFNVEKEGQVEIIGWMYQYYNTEPKDEVFVLLKKNVKITKERIPAATQLFTPDWIVRYMVENSLGRLWVEGHPNESLKENWKYYLEEAEQEPDVVVQLNKIREEYAKLNPVDIKIIDPCMGSGHILVYAFEVLMQIYKSQGYVERDAAKSILENNLYGIDIDVRAYQLAYFAVMMKARQYNRKIFSENITPNLIAIRNPEKVSKSVLNRLGGLEPLGLRLLENFQDAEEYGSILQVDYSEDELKRLDNRLIELEQDAVYGDILVQSEMIECVKLLKPIIKQAIILGQNYDVVVTNPPYRAVSDCSDKLIAFAKKYYPHSKKDLSTIFMERTLKMCKHTGYMGMINIPVWMSKTSFEDLRNDLLRNNTFVNMLHCGRGIFGSDFGTTSFVMLRMHISSYRSKFYKLFNGIGDVDSLEQKEAWFYERKGEYVVQPDLFLKISSYPIAYWVSPRLLEILNSFKSLSLVAAPRKGLTTGDNERFVRLWFEISINKFGINGTKSVKWYPMTKGGDYRRWYGNNSYVVNWENDGYEIRNFKDSKGNLCSVLRNTGYYFHEGISWNDTTATGKIAFRYQNTDYIPNASGPCVYCDNHLLYYFGLLNSIVSQTLLEVLAPNMKFEVGQMALVPIVEPLHNAEIVERKVMECIDLCRRDWDSFETSWDFEKHPLLYVYDLVKRRQKEEINSNCTSLDWLYKEWESECEKRFNLLKNNEEELNRFFIDAYGLQEELSPTVLEKDVTIHKASLSREIRSLISYAVGCMFGRYSLDCEGIVYAGGSWNGNKFHTFIPDPDNCIPITDEEYFTDDIVGRFVEFMKVAFGSTNLEVNLDFVAAALGKKGNTSREVIRNYFLYDFYNDHCQMYTVTGGGKRPIYWLFDSGKQNGFKALVYMHRWNADTVGNLRIEYLHKMQNVYEHEIETCQDMIDHGSGRDVAVATKRKEKLVKQLKECKDYDALVAHIAFSKIDIDLDDGVKVNYRKVQTGADGKFCEILANSKDIMAKEK